MRTILHLKNPPCVLASAAVGGKTEGKGPLGERFDLLGDDDRFGQKTWEHAEGEMSRLALNLALKKAGFSSHDLDLVVSGDLQNQCVASSLGLYTFGAPYLGLYGACSTCTEALLILSTMLSESDTMRLGAAVTSSHNSAAERQFRTPIEYGGQRAPSAQWTATAAGAFLLGKSGSTLRITDVMPGKIIDGAISDASDMGAAMAPAAADSILTYFSLSDTPPEAFDFIVTGDLGVIGSELLCEILRENGLSGAADRHADCGMLLYDRERQDVHAGGSGCGCSASVLSTYFLPKFHTGEVGNLLFLSTGALMSPSSVQQGDHIFGVAPAIHLQKGENRIC